jgi:HAMP domain-containing protein
LLSKNIKDPPLSIDISPVPTMPPNAPPSASSRPVTPFPGTGFARAYPKTLLPSPAKIRALNIATGNPNAHNPNRPPPVRVPELGLLVKYGGFVTREELDAQRYAYRELQGRVPVPEVVGWAEDAGQGFLYMELINAPTLASRWCGLPETERRALSQELRGMVQAWRALKQDPNDVYVGE